VREFVGGFLTKLDVIEVFEMIFLWKNIWKFSDLGFFSSLKNFSQYTKN
jgi:hypothetical protein